MTNTFITYVKGQNHSNRDIGATMSDNQRKFSILIWLPWLLLILAIFACLWLYAQSKQPQPLSSTEPQWQPPTPQIETASTPAELPDTPAPIASYHRAVAKAAQSVVNIYTTQKVKEHPYLNDPELRRFFEFYGQTPQQEQGATNLGSGVIVSKNGYIVTNAHVIDKADEVIVALNDGRKAKAKIIGVDADSDLAVIKVDMNGLKPLSFRDKPIEVGDVALAIGNPFGVGQTVTQGIISATGRTGLGVNTFEDFIQTDAAINPGNSGGALVDANGNLVGINTVIFSRSGGSMGIGFAIPTNLIKQVMNALIQNGRVSRGWLGIEVQSTIKDPTQLDTSTGVQVFNIIANSPAEHSGLKVGDIILNFDGVEMTDANKLVQYIAQKSPDTILKAQVLRDGKTLDLNIQLGERPTKNTPNQLAQPSNRLSPPQSSQESLNQNRDRLHEELLNLLQREMQRSH